MPYLISYIATGTIFTLGLLLSGRIARGRWFVASLVTIVFWPIIVIFAPETLFVKDEYEPSRTEKRDRLRERLSAALKNSDEIDGDIRSSLISTEMGGERSVAYFSIGSETNAILEEFWQSNIPPAALQAVRSARYALEDHPDEQLDVLAMASRAEPSWLIGFSNEFLKCISRADGKLRGRVLDAVGKISSAPMEPVGDTVKPLTAALSGLWRYRIGDHRLVYLPDRATKKITLLYFGARSGVYTNL